MKFPLAPVLAVVTSATAPIRNAIAPAMPLILTVTVSALVVFHLVVEILVAMLAYIYLNLYHMETFGHLIGIARYLLDLLARNLEQLSPDLAQRAYATLLGELGPKSFLLLVIGLVVSTMVRFVLWLIHKGLRSIRAEKK